ncbi:hypothetical protein F2Q69_00027157 [Brassica cretica]|uniref:Uncharacterized protein n=1 Tax=Brassica cretica TaxID=69181 RepID=A0A8S9S5M6_BRACR|nr:hypothetical protein F2Q69_00027157 [Brassica cretica]
MQCFINDTKLGRTQCFINDTKLGSVVFVKTKAQQSPINLQETLDFEPSERDIGELSQPPSTEIRSVTPPPSHALGHQCVRDVEMNPGQEFHPESRRDALTRAGGRFARESHAPPSPPDVLRRHCSRPPSVRRREAAAASPPRLHRRR